MLERNDKLLENSSYLVTYLRKNTNRGGTFYTVSKAEKQNLKICNVDDYI